MVDKKAITVRLPDHEHDFLRIISAHEGISMGEFLLRIVTAELDVRRAENPDPVENSAVLYLDCTNS